MKKRIWILLFTVVVIVGWCIWYINDGYDSRVTIDQFQGNPAVEITAIREGIYLDGPGAENALIFYPGAKVEYTSYLPICYELAENGIDCFLVKMPCNLAFLGQKKAQGLIEYYTYKNWYLSGHSLGGAMAASFAAEHQDEIDGLILLAAYPTKSLGVEGFSVLSVYGSEDGVLNMEKVEEGRKLMPADYTEVCIEGGNHAYFGNYGEQKGDGEAKITREEQTRQTAGEIINMIVNIQ